MIRTDDVQRLIRVLKEHEYDCWPIPTDMRKTIIRTLTDLVRERDALRKGKVHAEEEGD